MCKHRMIHQLAFMISLLFGLTITGINAKANPIQSNNVNHSNNQIHSANYVDQSHIQNYRTNLVNQSHINNLYLTQSNIGHNSARWSNINRQNSQPVNNIVHRSSTKASLNNIQYHHNMKRQTNRLYNHIIRSKFINLHYHKSHIKRFELKRHLTKSINVNNNRFKNHVRKIHYHRHYAHRYSNFHSLGLGGKKDINNKVKVTRSTKNNFTSNSNLHIKHHHIHSWFRDGLNKRNYRARKWVSWHESNHRWRVLSYGGVCVGYFQLNPNYLGYRHGHVDLRKRHQVKVADRYVKYRYGDWVNAKAFWEIHHWY